MSTAIEMPLELPAWQRSDADELVNAATHAIGCLLAISGAVVIAGSVFRSGNMLSIIGCIVYLASLIAVYAMSTLSHSARSLQWKLLFRRLDQGAIFLLIAATYTPFSIAYLPSAPWWILLAAIWTMAIAGFVSKVFFCASRGFSFCHSVRPVGLDARDGCTNNRANHADTHLFVDDRWRRVLHDWHSVPGLRRPHPPLSRRLALIRHCRKCLSLRGNLIGGDLVRTAWKLSQLLAAAVQWLPAVWDDVSGRLKIPAAGEHN